MLKTKYDLRKQIIWAFFLIFFMLSTFSMESHAATTCSHIWATKYDSSNHWEYCTNCGETRNKKAHSYTDHWQKSGTHCQDGNYSIRTCSCGYSYHYTEPHNLSGGWHGTGNRCVHYKVCSVCGCWCASARCHNSRGGLGCGNGGYCDECGTYISSSVHSVYITNTEIKCSWCGKQFGTISNKRQEYNSNHTRCTYSFRINKTYSGLRWTNCYMYTNNGNSSYSGYGTNGSNYIDVTVNFSINTNAGFSSVYSFDGLNATVDGTTCHVSGGAVTIMSDFSAPVITGISQTPQKEYKGWVTINKLTITGTENNSEIVYLSIKDLSDPSIKPLTDAACNVSGRSFKYDATPLLEGASAGRTYRLTVRDKQGNESYKDFVVKKTDCKAPVIISKTKFDGWSGTKTVTLQIRDYGYGYDNGTGSVKVSLNNNSSYKNATLSSKGVYTVTYTFPNETSKLETYNVYLQDGLNNTQITPIYVGYIDNTKPTISSAPITYLANNKGATVKVTASDARSGVYQYGYKYEKDSNITWQTGNTITLNKYGSYMFYVKDNAGNTQTKPLAIGYIVTYDVAGGTSSKTSDIAALTCSLTDASRKGYTFDGWFDGNTLVGAPGKSYSPGKHVTLKAHWTPIIYYIKYNTYEGELKKEKVVSYTVESPDIVLENPTLDGKEFTGWSDWNDPTPKKPYIIPKGTIGDLIISANWKVDPDSVNGNGGNGGNGSGGSSDTDGGNGSGDNNTRFAESSKIKSNKFVMK